MYIYLLNNNNNNANKLLKFKCTPFYFIFFDYASSSFCSISHKCADQFNWKSDPKPFWKEFYIFDQRKYCAIVRRKTKHNRDLFLLFEFYIFISAIALEKIKFKINGLLCFFSLSHWKAR